jgi:branched-chain amino acid transport system ATP-binding protein
MSSNGKGAPLLSLRDINTHYGPIHILQNVNLEVYSGELICLLGGNASGKSTTLKTILGIVRPTSGIVEFNGEAVQTRPTGYRVERGMAVVPENRRIFGSMSVLENLQMGSYLRRDKDGIQEDLERVLKLFPRLKERLKQYGGTLSGGEQQMLAMGRALMSRPKLLLMDEPSMGLAPILVQNNFELIKQVNQQGTTIFMVEQNANMALSIANRGYVVQTGRIVLADDAKNLLNNEHLRKAYLGR